jgi:hypothetical protein
LALTVEQKALIQTMNVNAKEILKQGGQEALLISLLKIKTFNSIA